MKSRRPTQDDVAKLAGVSQTAVSRVLNETDSTISEGTRKRIFDVIAQIGYVPNKSAQSLRTQRTQTIASIIPDITNPFYPAFQRGIQSVTNQKNYDLVIYDTDENEENEKRSLTSLARAGVDGAIVSLFHHGFDALKPLTEMGMPVVYWHGGPVVEDLLIDLIYVDNVAMAKTAVSFLIEKGHLRIGMIAGLENTPPRQDRIQGFREAMRENNVPLDEILIQDGDFTEVGGYQGMKKLLDLQQPPTAVFAANDLMALGAMLAIREAGLRIPEDIALIGLDDIPAAKLVNPPLTTLTQNQENIGRTAAEMIFERIEGTAPKAPRLVELPFDLIIRESV
ncbi:MAG: LacI family DNA-binding transcriptional regulator [Candidatus Helarchaeota archaeon]